MKKQIKVVRSGGKTMVIYQDAPVKRVSKKVSLKQKAVPVVMFGEVQYYVMPSGKIVYPRRTLARIIYDCFISTKQPSFA